MNSKIFSDHERHEKYEIDHAFSCLSCCSWSFFIHSFKKN